MLERYVIPLAPYILLLAGLMVALLWFTCLEKEIRRLKGRLSPQRKSSSADLDLKLEDLSARLRDAEERAAILPPVSVKPSLNLNKRTQVIRMSRRGEPAQSIAASLSLPRKEVELLLKVYGLTLNGSHEITS
jgi:hypothetical protein